MQVSEGLQAGDLEGIVEKRFSIDQYKSKMGDDKDICVLSFVCARPVRLDNPLWSLCLGRV